MYRVWSEGVKQPSLVQPELTATRRRLDRHLDTRPGPSPEPRFAANKVRSPALPLISSKDARARGWARCGKTAAATNIAATVSATTSSSCNPGGGTSSLGQQLDPCSSTAPAAKAARHDVGSIASSRALSDWWSSCPLGVW